MRKNLGERTMTVAEAFKKQYPQEWKRLEAYEPYGVEIIGPRRWEDHMNIEIKIQWEKEDITTRRYYVKL